MDAIPHARRPTSQIDYYAFAKAGVTSVALMALSIGAMKGIERYTNRSFTPFQRNLAYIALGTIYLIGAARFGGPFTKEFSVDKASPEDRVVANTTLPSAIKQEEEPPEVPVDDSMRQYGQELSVERCTSPLARRKLKIVLAQSERDLFIILIDGLRKAIFKNSIHQVTQTFFFRGEKRRITIDISGPELRKFYLRCCEKLLLFLQSSPRRALLPRPSPVKEVKDETGLSLPAALREDDISEMDFYFVEESEQDPVKYQAVQYVEKTHGVNGSLMRNRFFGALLAEIKRGVEVEREFVQGNLDALKERYSIYLSYEEGYLKTMYSALVDNDRDPETRYGELVIAHRKLIDMHLNATPSSITANRIISRAFVRARMSPKMQVFQESFVGQFIGEHESTLSLESFSKEFIARNNAVKSAPAEMKMHYGSKWVRQFCGALSREDYFTVNPPNHLETIALKKTDEEPRAVEYIRESTPHISGATIDPIFREYLNLLKEEKKGFLYSAHQRLKDQKEGLGYYVQVEVENSRSQTLIDLENYHPNFILIFQSVENDLFIKGSKTFDDLKTKIRESFTNPSGRNQNRLPPCLKDNEDYNKRMDDMLDNIHRIFFNGQTVLTDRKEARQSFIMIFYAMQRHDLITGDYKKGFPIGVFTTPCKDFYDRGLGQAIMTRLFNLMQIHGKDIPSEKLEEIANAGQFPPLLGKGVAAIPHRIDPALDAIEGISKLEDLRPFQALDFHGWKVDDTTVHRSPMQSAVSQMI